MKHNAIIGTVSSGTMREQDLVRSFIWEIEYLEDVRLTAEELQIPEDALEDEDNEWWDTEDASFLLNELFDRLEEHAPSYCYFGAHDGDGSDFGFWPLWDSINDEVTRVDELPDGPFHPDEFDDGWTKDNRVTNGCLLVNDHGNATLYFWDASKQDWVEEWGIA